MHESSQRNNFNASLNADAPIFQPKSPAASSTATPVDMLMRAMLEFHLPRPEQMKFDGSAKNFQAFMSSFKCNIADKVADPSLKLTYLIQHCSGDAKKLIKDCVLLPTDSAYGVALEKLENRFGQNHLIARSYIDDITTGPAVKANDVNSLVSLADDMNNCQTVLSQLRFTSDLDSSGTLRSIVKRLPNAIQSKWVEKVSSILEKDREPTFQDLASFVEARARVASSMYGRDFANANKSKPPEKQSQEARSKKDKQSKPNVSTLTTQVQKETNAPKSKEQKEKPQAVAATPQKPSAAPERPLCLNCELSPLLQLPQDWSWFDEL